MDDAEFERRLHGEEFRAAHRLTGMVAVTYAGFTPEQREVAREGILSVFREMDGTPAEAEVDAPADEAVQGLGVVVVELSDVTDLDEVARLASDMLAGRRSPVKVYAAVREAAAQVLAAFRDLPERERPR